MAICLLLFITVIIGNRMLTDHQTTALEINGKTPILRSLLGYVIGSIKGIPKKALNPPENTNTSIQYLLYTPDHPDTTCYLEPNLDALKRCPFNSSYPMKFLIHGFLSTIHPGGLFMMIKDEMLKIYQYNVIVVDWSPYNQPPYMQAAINTLSVGRELANLIQFLMKSAGVEAKNIHLIGHSLGAHLSGAAGEKIPNLGRITGFGEEEPLGDQDFYPNGGKNQPQCLKESKNTSFLNKRICNHSAAISYFLQSVNSSKCTFFATKCDSHSDFQKGLCSNDSSPVAEMGLPAEPISGLPPKSEFFLRTSPSQPYCLKDGYEPE